MRRSDDDHHQQQQSLLSRPADPSLESVWSHLPSRTVPRPTIHRRVIQMVATMSEQDAMEMLRSMGSKRPPGSTSS